MFTNPVGQNAFTCCGIASCSDLFHAVSSPNDYNAFTITDLILVTVARSKEKGISTAGCVSANISYFTINIAFTLSLWLHERGSADRALEATYNYYKH
jgi:hypothetical protein